MSQLERTRLADAAEALDRNELFRKTRRFIGDLIHTEVCSLERVEDAATLFYKRGYIQALRDMRDIHERVFYRCMDEYDAEEGEHPDSEGSERIEQDVAFGKEQRRRVNRQERTHSPNTAGIPSPALRAMPGIRDAALSRSAGAGMDAGGTETTS